MVDWQLDLGNQIYIGLGANLDWQNKSPIENMLNAIGEIEKLFGVIKKSSFYKSPAWPIGSNSPDYSNCAIGINAKIDAFELMEILLSIEEKYGRVRNKENQWAARTLDLDMIDFGSEIINETKDNVNLQIPHPRLELRDFVILPLQEIAPNWINPLSKKSISQIANEFLQLNHQFTAQIIDTY
jgi:2-amino-4-hydroxy-6-hydroxymethyldihydropteridine diphosphokinase